MVVQPETGRLWSRTHSVFFKYEKGFNWPALGNILVRGVSADMVPVTTALVTYFSREIGVSPAVVQSFTTLSSFMTAVGFYYSYGERLTYQHIGGMLMIVGSVLIVAVAKSLEQSNVSNELYQAAVNESEETGSPPVV